MLDEPIALLCSACERPIRAGARFCSACGHTHAAEPPAAAASELSLGSVVVAQSSELTRIAWLYGLLLISSLVCSWFMSVDSSPWPGVGMSVFDALLVVGYVATRPAEILALLGPPRMTRAMLLQIAGATCGCVLLLLGYFAAMARMGFPTYAITDEYAIAGWPTWSMFVLISVMPAVFEELSFRGVIQCALERVFNAREAHIIQAALFSIVHMSPMIFASHFLMGFYFGWLRNQTRSLYPSMLAHAAWNAYCIADELWWA